MIKNIVDFPLKILIQINILDPFKEYITNETGLTNWKKIEPIITNISNQRRQLDFLKITTEIKNGTLKYEDIQKNLITYIRHVYMLDNIFKSSFTKNKNPLKCNFLWTDTLNNKVNSVSISSLKYELICSLYNLAILYYKDSCNLLLTNKENDQVEAVSKLRRAIWCFAEIKQQISQAVMDPKLLPVDLGLGYLSILSNYFVGLSYSILINILNARKTKFEKLASANKAAAQSFQIAVDTLDSNLKILNADYITKQLKPILIYYAVVRRFDAYDNIVKYHIDNADDEILKGHMGLAISYLKLTKNDLDMIINKKELFDKLTPDQKNEINKLSIKTIKNIEIYNEKNAKIYHQKECDLNSLPELPNESKPIEPIEPKDIKAKIEEESLLEELLSPEIIALREEFMNLISANQTEIENLIKNTIETKNKIYSQYCINYLLDVNNASPSENVDVSEKLSKKIEKFYKNGGLPNYEKIKQFSENSSKQALALIQDIKKKLELEQEQDDLCRLQYENQWQRPKSDELNQSYTKSIQELEQKYNIAVKLDQEINERYAKVYEWMKKFSGSSNLIGGLIPDLTDNTFVKTNKNELLELGKLNKELEDILNLGEITNLFIILTEDFLKSDYLQDLIAIKNQKVEKSLQFEKMMSSIKQKIDAIITKINNSTNILNQISQKAKDLNEKKNSSGQDKSKFMEEISLNISLINALYDDLNKGSTFYSKLIVWLANLQDIVGDYCIAREFDKDYMIQELQTKMNYSMFNKSANLTYNK